MLQHSPRGADDRMTPIVKAPIKDISEIPNRPPTCLQSDNGHARNHSWRPYSK